MNDRIHFRDDCQLWWPDYDHKPDKALPFVMKHLPDVDRTIELCAKKEVCVQAGAHVGLWPKRLAQKGFEMVVSFEPDVPLYQCALRNLHDEHMAGTVRLYPQALGAFCGRATLERRSSAGSSRIVDLMEQRALGATTEAFNATVVEMVTIDSLRLPKCDAIILDVEGHEVQVLEGAGMTLARFSPVLHLEELEDSGPDIRDYVKMLGYRLSHRVGKDAVYTRRRQ